MCAQHMAIRPPARRSMLTCRTVRAWLTARRPGHVRAQDYRRARYLEANAIQVMVFGRAIWPQLPHLALWRWTNVTTDNVAGTALSPCGHRFIPTVPCF